MNEDRIDTTGTGGRARSKSELCTCGAKLGKNHADDCPAAVGLTNCPYCFVVKGKPHRSGCPLGPVLTTAPGPTVDVVAAITAARGSVYGPFIYNAMVGQAIRDAMRKSIPSSAGDWNNLPVDVREALDYIAGKISRIVTGDPEYLDNWHDISGYCKIIADRITKTKGET